MKILNQFKTIHLNEMQHVALLKRVEVKYVLPAMLLPRILDTLNAHYDVMDVAGQRLNQYRTLYFDTNDFSLYRRHHMGAADRYKIRSRTYMDSDSSFLEVKHKTNKKRVIKSRIETSEPVVALDGDAARFVSSACLPYDIGDMRPRLWNNYRRVTLVNKVQKERVTLDLDLRFNWSNRTVTLPHVIVAEVKQERLSQPSQFIQRMRQHHIRNTGFSKYCIGASLLYSDLKQNRFKKKHQLLAKLAEYGMPSGEPHEFHRTI